ncbi:MAG: efflux RND transporter permease subunit, partial [Candidatus Saccharimonadales bacterium]
MATKSVKKNTATEKLRPLQKLSLFFFKRPKLTAGLAILILAFGVLSYTTLLKRDGFPAINVPFAIGQGTYFVNDAQKLDEAVTKPISKVLLQDDSVATVRTSSLGNFYTVAVQYDEGTDAAAKTKELQTKIYNEKILPPQATLQFEAAKFGVTQRGDDAVISFVSKTDPNKSSVQVAEDAQKAVELLLANKGGLIADASVIQPVEQATNPVTGQLSTLQTKFERYGVRENDASNFYSAVAIGVTSVKGADALAFDDQLQKVSEMYAQKYPDSGYKMYVSAGYAPSIRQQISELQKTLLEGLLAVLVVGSIVIAFRASIVTVLSMVTVIVSVIGLLYGIGYTLNTITLFALILGLSLIVDDTIIMVEALDKQRQRYKDREKIVAVSVQKVGRAM